VFQSTKVYKLALLLPAILLFCLVVFKAFKAPITHDEAYSFEVYSSKSIPSILAFKEDISANNHLFNTLFMKAAAGLGFQHPFYLRMLSVLSFAFFLLGLYQLLNLNKHYIVFILLLIPAASPYLLDFFSLARGYAFSFALMIWSIYLFVKSNALKKQQFWAIQVATFAMLANFNLVYVWFSLMAFHSVTFAIQFKKQHLVSFIKSILFPALSFLYLVYVFKQLSNAEQLYFGGKEGFLENVIKDQLWCFIYDQAYALNPSYLSIWLWTIPLLILSALVLFLNTTIRTNQSFKDWLIVMYVLIFSLCLIALNHYTTGSLYPIKRTGLFVSILVFLCLAVFLRFIFDLLPNNKLILFIVILFVGSLFVHTLSSFHPKRYREIPYDSHTIEIIQKLAEFKNENEVLSFSANWQFSPGLNFYKQTQCLNWLPKIEKAPIDTNAQFLLVFEEDLPQLNTLSLQQHLFFAEDGVYLFENRAIKKEQ
jgi:hypothetical protein